MNVRPLVEGLSELRSRTRSGELAYFCLSGKSENHIRDLVSFNIARAHPTWLVQREIDRVDLTVTSRSRSPIRIEFKLGYAAVVAQTKGDCPAIRGVEKDFRKRPDPIVSCLGLMHFEGEETDCLETYRNKSLIRRSLKSPSTRQEAQEVVRMYWPNRSFRCVPVDCGRWNGLSVSIDFAVISPGGRARGDH